MEKKKKFRLFDAVLAAVCIVLVVEAAAPAAAIGNMQYFWWIFLLAAFFLPYALVNAELGTTYTGEGGLYDWVSRAFGKRMGSRVAWYYWINFPIWMGSLAVMFTDIFTACTGITLSWVVSLIIQLVFIWVIVFISGYRVSESKWLINIGAIVKVLLMVSVGVLGIYVAVTRGMANNVTEITSPLAGLSFVSIILFNFMGFEVVATFADDMENPKREIPKAIIVGGILIAVFYLFSAFGIGVAIPIDQLSLSSGFLDSFAVMLGTSTGPIIMLVGILFMFTLIANLISWSPGVNFVAMYAAKDGALPKLYSSENKHGMPLGANLANGIVATLIVVIAAILSQTGGDLDIFWTFFALNVVTLIGSYIFLFPAFTKLRKMDPDIERPFKIGGGTFVKWLVTLLPLILIILAIIFCLFPYDPDIDGLTPDWWLIIGTVVAIIIGEILAAHAAHKERIKR